jgi:hypothetical protein
LIINEEDNMTRISAYPDAEIDHGQNRKQDHVSTTSPIAWVVITALSLAIAALASRYFQFDPATYFAEQRQVYVKRELALGVHIFGGIVALVTGPFQFVASIRHRWVKLHRALGIVYVSGCTVAALGGLALASTAHGGAVASWGFTFLALFSLVTTYTALAMALAHRFADHRRWMIRSFSLTFAGVMLRLLVGVYSGLHAAGLVSFGFTTAYIAIAWLCWVPNLLLAFWVTRTNR